jgi:hypothetical protein
MIPTWLLTIWHLLSIASAIVVLVILCWQALRPRTDQPQIDGDTTEYVQAEDSPYHESN